MATYGEWQNKRERGREERERGRLVGGGAKGREGITNWIGGVKGKKRKMMNGKREREVGGREGRGEEGMGIGSTVKKERKKNDEWMGR